MKKKYEHYSMIVQWSEVDKVYIVTVPELPGCRTHGKTYKEAVKQGKDAIESWIDASEAWGTTIPEPRIFTAESEYDFDNWWKSQPSRIHTRADIAYEHYSMIIQWSEPDNVYLVGIPELPGCITHGATYEKAVKAGKELLEIWIDACVERGEPIPEPDVFVDDAA